MAVSSWLTPDTASAKALGKGNAADVMAHLRYRFKNHPALMEQLGQRADDILASRRRLAELLAEPVDEASLAAQRGIAAVEGKPVPELRDKSEILHDIAVERQAIKANQKELRKWGKKQIKEMNKPGAIWSGFEDNLKALQRTTHYDRNSRGLPSMAAMAKLLRDGKKSIDWVPAHHISVAKTVMQIRRLRKTNPEKYATLRIRFGDTIVSAEQLLRRFDNFPSIDNYMRVLDREFHLPNLHDMDVVYHDRLPFGISAPVEIGQQNALARQTRAIRKLLLTGGRESVAAKLLAEDTFWRNLNTYAPDFYRQYLNEFQKAGLKDPAQLQESLTFMVQHGYNGDRYRHAVNKAMKHIYERETGGMIRDPRYYVPRAIFQITGDVLFKNMTKSLASATTKEGVPLVFQAVESSPGVFKKHAATPPGYIQAGYTSFGNKERGAHRWLDLEGTYIHPEIYHYLKGARNIDPKGVLYWINKELINRWKFGATVLNPVTHLRNVFSNLIMSDMAGMNPMTSKSAREAWKNTIEEMMQREGPLFDKASQAQLFGKDFRSAELQEFTKNLWAEMKKVDPGTIPEVRGLRRILDMQNKTDLFQVAGQITKDYYLGLNGAIGRVVKGAHAGKGLTGGKRREMYERIMNSLGQAYSWEDEIFKLWRFKQLLNLQDEFRKTRTITSDMRRALGKDDAYVMRVLGQPDGVKAWRAAAEDSHKWFFNYADVSGFVEMTRKTTIPFFTYMTKALPRVGQWFSEHPVKAFFWRQSFDYMNFTNEYMYGEGNMEEIVENFAGLSELGPWAQLTAIPGGTGEQRRFDIETRRYRKSGIKRKVEDMVQLAPYWDAQYWTQLANLYQMSDPRGAGFTDRLLEFTLGQTPITTTIAATAFNRPEWDKWGAMGGRIWHEEDSAWESFSKWSATMWRTWSPQWMPGFPLEGRGDDGEYEEYLTSGAGLFPGGRAGQKIGAAVKKAPDYRVSRMTRKFRQMDETFAEIMGFKRQWVKRAGRDWIKKQHRRDKRRLKRTRDNEIRRLEASAADYKEQKAAVKQRYKDRLEFLHQFDQINYRRHARKGYRFGKAIQAGNRPWFGDDD